MSDIDLQFISVFEALSLPYYTTFVFGFISWVATYFENLKELMWENEVISILTANFLGHSWGKLKMAIHGKFYMDIVLRQEPCFS